MFNYNLAIYYGKSEKKSDLRGKTLYEGQRANSVNNQPTFASKPCSFNRLVHKIHISKCQTQNNVRYWHGMWNIVERLLRPLKSRLLPLVQCRQLRPSIILVCGIFWHPPFDKPWHRSMLILMGQPYRELIFGRYFKSRLTLKWHVSWHGPICRDRGRLDDWN